MDSRELIGKKSAKSGSWGHRHDPKAGFPQARGRGKAARRREKAEQGCGMTARRDFPRKRTQKHGAAQGCAAWKGSAGVDDVLDDDVLFRGTTWDVSRG